MTRMLVSLEGCDIGEASLQIQDSTIRARPSEVTICVIICSDLLIVLTLVNPSFACCGDFKAHGNDRVASRG